MNFSDDEWLTIARSISRATERGALDWTGPIGEAPWVDVVYTTHTPNGTTYQLRSRDNDGAFPYVLSVLDSDGTEAASFVTRPFAADDWEGPDDVTGTIMDLWSSVERLVTGAPQKAKSLIDELRALAPEDPTPF